MQLQTTFIVHYNGKFLLDIEQRWLYNVFDESTGRQCVKCEWARKRADDFHRSVHSKSWRGVRPYQLEVKLSHPTMHWTTVHRKRMKFVMKTFLLDPPSPNLFLSFCHLLVYFYHKACDNILAFSETDANKHVYHDICVDPAAIFLLLLEVFSL